LKIGLSRSFSFSFFLSKIGFKIGRGGYPPARTIACGGVTVAAAAAVKAGG